MGDLLDLVVPGSVRRLCRSGLTAKDLPDEDVRDEAFTLPAVAELLALDPDAAAREGVAEKHVRSALNRLVAARVLPTLSLLEKEDFGDGGGLTRQKLDVKGRAAELRSEAREEIAFVLKPAEGAPSEGIPTFFTLGRGRRGR